MKEWINGCLYVNGYATDSYGRPRTMSNGYSSEDEKDAKEQYEMAKFLQQEEYREEISQEESVKPAPKITKKKRIRAKKVERYDFAGRPNFYNINGETWDIEYINGKTFIGGYATNDAGHPICFENGYVEEDVIQSVNLYNQYKSQQREIIKNW